MIIQNRGQAIVASDYWDTEHAAQGYFYLSWNAGAARLLVPDSQKGMLREMKGAREVIISRGPWPEYGQGKEGLELLWEDGSDSPYCIHLPIEQSDRRLPDTDQGSGFVVSAWTRGREGVPQQHGRWPGRYRRVPSIPYLLPWQAH